MASIRMKREMKDVAEKFIPAYLGEKLKGFEQIKLAQWAFAKIMEMASRHIQQSIPPVDFAVLEKYGKTYEVTGIFTDKTFNKHGWNFSNFGTSFYKAHLGSLNLAFQVPDVHIDGIETTCRSIEVAHLKVVMAPSEKRKLQMYSQILNDANDCNHAFVCAVEQIIAKSSSWGKLVERWPWIEQHKREIMKAGAVSGGCNLGDVDEAAAALKEL